MFHPTLRLRVSHKGFQNVYLPLQPQHGFQQRRLVLACVLGPWLIE
jgi:hypothetical protein